MSEDRPRRRLLRLLLLVGVPALCAAGAVLVWQRGGRFVTTENAYVKADIVNVANDVSGIVAANGEQDDQTLWLKIVER